MDLVTPSPRGEPYQKQERKRDCVVVHSPQASSMQELGSSIKKICLGEQRPELQQKMIETRQEELNPTPAYNPQVEAISPTPPPDNVVEDNSFCSIKDELYQKLRKVERETSKVESMIVKLKKKEQELKEAAFEPDEKNDIEEERLTQQPNNQSLAQKISAENKRKALKSHLELEKLGPKVELPLYNQPSDTAVYHENKRKYFLFKNTLLKNLHIKNRERDLRERLTTETYSQLVQEWHQKVEKTKSSVKRKAKDAKNRELFEKVFPELRKERENRERVNRVGTRMKSEADFEEIMDRLQEQEMEDKKMRSYAVIPPLLLDIRQQPYCYVNKNGRIADFAAEYKERQLLNIWTKAEREIFKEKFLQDPKNFGVIASFLDRKSASDCVQYYYYNKKKENYKQLLRKSRQRTRSSRNHHGKVKNISGATASASGDLSEPMGSIFSSVTGVMTRLQREQLQKQEHSPVPPPPRESDILPKPVCDTHTLTKESKDNNPSPLLVTIAVKPPPVREITARIANSEMNLDSKKKERRKKEKKRISELSHTKHTSLLCEAENTPALPQSHTAQYGLCEEDVPIGARVSGTCQCKSCQQDLLHQKQQQQQVRESQQVQQMKENHLRKLHHHHQPEHHRLGIIQQLPSGYPEQHEGPAGFMQQLSQTQAPSCPHPDNSGREGSGSTGSNSTGNSVNRPNGSGQGGDAPTLTAARLIDAIITDKINQTSSKLQTGQGTTTNCSVPQQQVTSPGDRLFQRFHREGSEANGKLLSLKSEGVPMAASPAPKQGSLSVREHIASIINKDYPPSCFPQYQGYKPETWKFCRALLQKELDKNQVLREKNDGMNIVRTAASSSPSSRTRCYEPPAVPLSPLDFVKSRILEVLQTSEEEKGSKSARGESLGFGDEGEERTSHSATPQAPAPTFVATSAYTYPFSALRLNAVPPSVPVSVASSAPKEPIIFSS